MEIILVLSVAAIVLSCGALYLSVAAQKSAQEALNRIEMKYEDICHKIAADRILLLQVQADLEATKKLIPEDVVEERQRRNVLMRDLNNEMERRIKAEEAWNKMVEGVLGYDIGVARRGGENRDG